MNPDSFNKIIDFQSFLLIFKKLVYYFLFTLLFSQK